MTDRTCIAPHCERPVRCKDRCARCYQRARKSGEIPAAWISPPHYSSFEERFWCKVDQETTPEGCWTWTAYRSPDGYGRFGIYTGRNAVAHRVSYELEVGPIPDGMNIDHKCHNRACVRPDHLRAVTQKQNVENRSGLRIGNTSGVNGVSWARKQKAWRATVRHNYRTYVIGHYADIQEAAAAVKAARNVMFTHNDLDRTG